MRPSVKPVVLVLFLLTIFALAPAALAAKPTRTFSSAEDWVLPAGLGCAFDVAFDYSANSGGVSTEFDDGRTVWSGHGEVTLTNLDTGTTYVWRSNYRAIESYDPVTNGVSSESSGRAYFILFPGDQGPDGVVGQPGALLGTFGNGSFTYDLDTEIVTSFSLVGHVTDLCAELS